MEKNGDETKSSAPHTPPAAMANNQQSVNQPLPGDVASPSMAQPPVQINDNSNNITAPTGPNSSSMNNINPSQPQMNNMNPSRPQASAVHFFVTLFATETRINFPATSHSFATFVAIKNDRIVEEVTISWIPAPGYFRRNYSLPRFLTVPGKNYTVLDETVSLYEDHEFTVHGALEVTPELFMRAKNRIKYLDSGAAEYKGLILSEIDRESSLDNMPAKLECIHAISDIAGPLKTGIDHGNRATRDVMRHFVDNGFVISDPRKPNLDVLRMMNLGRRLPNFKQEIVL